MPDPTQHPCGATVFFHMIFIRRGVATSFGYLVVSPSLVPPYQSVLYGFRAHDGADFKNTKLEREIGVFLEITWLSHRDRDAIGQDEEEMAQDAPR